MTMMMMMMMMMMMASEVSGASNSLSDTSTWNLNSGRISVNVSLAGITSMSLLPPPPMAKKNGSFAVPFLSSAQPFMADVNDGATLVLDGTVLVDLTPNEDITPIMSHKNETFVSLTYTLPANHLIIDVGYSLPFGATFVTKAIAVRSTKKKTKMVNVTSISTFDGALLTVQGKPCVNSFTATSDHGLGGYAVFLRWGVEKGASGAFLSTHNPYLNISVASGIGATTLNYEPYIMWNTSNVFHTDKGVIGVHSLLGHMLQPPAPAIDENEQAAMVAAVRSELVVPQNPSKTVKINIAWTENDYELDISLARDRETYKRIIDRASQYGITHILFAPQNSDVSSLRNNTDAWGWEQILWFGMGQRLRMGLWSPGDPLPDSLTEMLDYFKLKNVKPVAYVYPILAFLANTLPGGGSPPWIVNGTYDLDAATPHAQRNLLGNGKTRSNLASPEFHQWLPDTMVAFANATGAGGFGFDYTYFEENLPVASQYAQWNGWRKILSRLHLAKGGKACGGDTCVVDNRQQNHAWGPWMWAQGGTYAEPLMSDEQPSSWMFYEADLHTDRLAGNKERTIAWNYRQMEFCPPEVLPGFAFHQTDRDPTVKQKAVCPNGRCSNFSRTRDFDLLGHRYSLMSSIGTGGLNNVLNMMPARDEQEFKFLPAEDVAFVKNWLQWTDNNVALLQNTKVIRQLKQPSMGNLDGVAMVTENSGTLFLYNPTATAMDVSLPLDESLGFSCDVEVPFVVAQLGSSARGSIPFKKFVINCGDMLNVTVPATTALALDISGWGCVSAVPQVYGVEITSALVNTTTGTLNLYGAQGEAGSTSDIFVALPPGTQEIKQVLINGENMANFKASTYRNVPTVSLSGTWQGDKFAKSQQIGKTSAGFQGGEWTATFNVPSSVLQQLKQRNESYPIEYDLDPNGNNDANVPWLAPGRLLVFVKYQPLLNDSFNATGSIDGMDIIVRKAYNTIVPSSQRFIGYWADVTPMIVPNTKQTLTLNLPKYSNQWVSKAGALLHGDDVVVLQNKTVAQATKECHIRPSCVGVTFQNPNPKASSCGNVQGEIGQIFLKSSSDGNDDPSWCSLVQPAVFDGVYFDNVETLYSTVFTQP